MHTVILSVVCKNASCLSGVFSKTSATAVHWKRIWQLSQCFNLFPLPCLFLFFTYIVLCVHHKSQGILSKAVSTFDMLRPEIKRASSSSASLPQLWTEIRFIRSTSEMNEVWGDVENGAQRICGLTRIILFRQPSVLCWSVSPCRVCMSSGSAAHQFSSWVSAKGQLFSLLQDDGVIHALNVLRAPTSGLTTMTPLRDFSPVTAKVTRQVKNRNLIMLRRNHMMVMHRRQ